MQTISTIPATKDFTLIVGFCHTCGAILVMELENQKPCPKCNQRFDPCNNCESKNNCSWVETNKSCQEFNIINITLDIPIPQSLRKNQELEKDTMILQTHMDTLLATLCNDCAEKNEKIEETVYSIDYNL